MLRSNLKVTSGEGVFKGWRTILSMKNSVEMISFSTDPFRINDKSFDPVI